MTKALTEEQKEEYRDLTLANQVLIFNALALIVDELTGDLEKAEILEAAALNTKNFLVRVKPEKFGEFN